MPLPDFRPTENEEMLRCTQIRLLLSARMEVNEANWNYLLGCPFWRIYVNHRAGAFIERGNKRWELRPGHVYCIPAWMKYRSGSSTTVRHDYVHFEWSGLSPAWLLRCIPDPVELPLREGLEELCHRWQAGLAPGESPTLSRHVWTQAWVYAVVAALLAQRGPSLENQILTRLEETGRLRPALECIERQLAQPPSNREMAQRCNLSEDHFIKRFRLEIGMTPARYGLEYRITQAAQWLANSDRKIEEIAEATGFTDRFHLSRAFRAHLRESPGAYRRKFRPVQETGTSVINRGR